MAHPNKRRMKPTNWCTQCGCWRMPGNHDCATPNTLRPPVHRSSLIPPPPRPSWPTWLGTAAIALALLVLSAAWSYACYRIGASHATQVQTR